MAFLNPIANKPLLLAAEPMDLGFGVQLKWQGDGETGVPNLFKCAVCAWSKLLTGAAA